jgi:hypothetical protein
MSVVFQNNTFEDRVQYIHVWILRAAERTVPVWIEQFEI